MSQIAPGSTDPSLHPSAGMRWGVSVAAAGGLVFGLGLGGCSILSHDAPKPSGTTAHALTWDQMLGSDGKQKDGAVADTCAVWVQGGDAAKKALAQRITTQIQKSIIANHTAPGAAVVVGCGSTELVSVSVGRTRYGGKGTKVSAKTTKYDLASTTKPFTSTAALQLQAAGKLSLKDHVNKYLPQYTGGKKSAVTVQELFQHQAGLVDKPYKAVLAGAKTPAQAQARVIAQGPVKTPGSGFLYSNVGGSQAGMVVSKAAGEPLDTYVTANILKPLGMQNTTYHPTKDCAPTSSDYDQKIEYDCQAQDLLARAEGGVSGHAGLFSTAEDLGKFAAMFANHGTYEGKQILTPEQVVQISKANPISGYGLGMRTNMTGSHSSKMSKLAFGHTGWNGTEFIVDPTTGMWVVTEMNASLGQPIEGAVNNRINAASKAIIDDAASAYDQLAKATQ